MSTKFTYCYASVLVLLDLLDKSYLSSDANSFYPANDDVRYLVDTIPVSFRQELSGGPDINLHSIIEDHPLYTPRVHLKFFPPVLDFKQRDFGVPHHETVSVINTSCNKSVHMSSISGNTVHFHSSFFQDKVIPPLSNTTFDVVFLGRGEGEIKSTLFIHTSEGSFKYHVKGESSYSPYRLRSLSGVRLPLNASYSPLIVMHNPHSTSIQLSEVFSSSDEFHLELPSGDLEGPKQIWSVPAFLTKPIIRLRFQASSQKNHTAYIRFKVDETGEILIVPIDIEVGLSGGLYAPDDLIDFGIGGTDDPPKLVKLYLRNSGKKTIKIQSVYPMPFSKSLKIDFQPVRVPPDPEALTEVADLTLDWKSAFESGDTLGQIVIKCSNTNQKVFLSYMASVLDGGLHYDSNQTKFQSDQYEIEPRSITMTNRYKVPVTIFNVSLASEVAYYFQVVDFEPFVFHPGETRKLMVIEAIGGSLTLHLKLESEILVYSNVSTIHIPVLCYDGKLSKVLASDPSDTELYFGTVGSGSLKVVNFALVNENPVAVQILDLSLNMSDSTIYAVAIEKGNATTASVVVTSNEFNVTLSEPYIGPGYFCVVQVSVPAGPDPGNIYGEVKIETEYEVIRMPLFMRVEHGNLRVVTNPVEFNDCFPSAICMAEVRVESNFTVGMAVTGVASVPYQPRLGFIPVSPPLIPPLTTTLLGHVTWDMSGMESYLAPTTNTIGGHSWLDTLSIPSHIREWDISLLNSRYEQYSNISTELIELSLRLDTTEVRNVAFKAIIRPTWPSVLPLSTRNLSFPLTQVGKVSHQQLTIINPASKQSIILQLIFDSYYPLAKGILDDLPSSLRPPVNSSSESSVNDFRNTFHFVFDDGMKTLIDTDPDRNSIVTYLKPFSNITLTIGFNPERSEYSSSILLIRNNLTILEVVHLHGSGAYAHFKFGNRKPGSSTPLMFELAEKHLKDCEKEKILKNSGGPNLTVKRSFTARNVGALPLSITGFSINGHVCQGYGFRVLNCHPFLLPANSSKKIDIAFTPDFTLSRVERMLTIYTSALSANYTLMATLPPYLLSVCSSALSRPIWEPVIYYCSITFMTILLVCVLAAAIFESNRILRNTVIALSRDQNVQPVLDLRTMGNEVADETVVDPRDSSPKRLWSIESNVQKMTLKGNNISSGESYVHNSFHNKSIPGNGVIHKRKPDRMLSKRYSELEAVIDKSSWNSMFTRSVNNTAMKSVKSNICFTTEPYSPLANLKPRDTSVKVTDPLDRPKVNSLDDPSKKTKKKNEENKRKGVEVYAIANNFEEAESSSTTTESSSNDDGDKEVESMFFKTVRNHLQSKGGKSRVSRSPLRVRKSIDKSSSSPAENEWDAEDDVVLDKAIVVVRSCRRPNPSTNKLKRQNSASVKLKLDAAPAKCKISPSSEKNLKIAAKKERALSAKKPRMEKMDKTAGSKGPSVENTAPPPPPPPPVWTASFSDIVARSEFSYSSVVALKNTQQSASQKLPTPPPMADWKPKYQDIGDTTKEEPEMRRSSSTGPVGSKHSAFNSAWNNWSEPVQSPEADQHTNSTNSLFTHAPQQVPGNTFDNLWNEPAMSTCHSSLVKALQDQQDAEMEMPQSFNNSDMNWPAMPSLWVPLYTPSASVENPPPVWGSDVWAPPTPPSPTIQDEMVQHTMEYDPFRSLSNIWAQHSTNIWKPPTTE